MNGKNWLGRRVYFPVIKGVKVRREVKERGTVVRLTDTGAVIKGLQGGLYNRPWCEIEGVKEIPEYPILVQQEQPVEVSA